MEVPGLGIKLELQLPVYATAIVIPDLSWVCDLCYSSQQCQILNPPSKIRDQTRILMDTSQAFNLLSHNGNSLGFFFFFLLMFICLIGYLFLFRLCGWWDHEKGWSSTWANHVKQKHIMWKHTHSTRNDHEKTCPWELMGTLERTVDFHGIETGSWLHNI